MKIAFNPSTVAALTSPPDNKDITFDLRGHNIFARGVEFKGTDTWRPIVDNLTSTAKDQSLSANMGRYLNLIKTPYNNTSTPSAAPTAYNIEICPTSSSTYKDIITTDTGGGILVRGHTETAFNLWLHDTSNVWYKQTSGGAWKKMDAGNADYATTAAKVANKLTIFGTSYDGSAAVNIPGMEYTLLLGSTTTKDQAILSNGTKDGWKLQTLNIDNWNNAWSWITSITTSDTDKVINKWNEILNFLAGISSDDKLNTLLNSKLSVYTIADKTDISTIKNTGLYYTTTDASSQSCTNSPFTESFTLLNIESYNNGDDLRRSRLALTANGDIKVSNDRGSAGTAETWYGVLTSKNSSISGSTITINGSSITVNSSSEADGKYLKLSGGTMTNTAIITFADSGSWGAGTGAKGDIGGISWTGQSDGVKLYASETGNDNLNLRIKFTDDNSNCLQILNAYNTVVSEITSTGEFRNSYTRTYADTVTHNTSYKSDRRALILAGNTYGNDTNYINSAGKLSWGDGGPQIIFSTSRDGFNNAQSAALIYTDHDSIGTGVSLSLVTNQSDAYFVAPHIRALVNFIGNLDWSYITSKPSFYTKAESDARYITDITTSINKLTYTKNGANTDKAITVNVVQSQGRRNPLDGRNAISGIYTYSTYTKAGLAPSNYFETLGFGQGTAGTIELGGCWTSGGQLYWRALRDCCENWFNWNTILDSHNFNTFHHLLTNGNTTVDISTWTNPFSAYNKDSIADGQAICIWGQSAKKYSDSEKFSTDTGDISFWLKRVNASTATLNIVIDGDYYTGNNRLTKTGEVSNFIQVQQHTSNDVNYPLVWSNQCNSNSITTNQLYKSWSDLYYNPKNRRLTVGSSILTTNIDIAQGKTTSESTTTYPFTGIKGTCADNDFWRVGGGGTSSNSGYMEIATADDGTEPIYVRQYSGVFTTLKRTLTLLDSSGNTRLPGNLYFSGAGTSLAWDEGTYRQRILTTDDSTANTKVFSFQQSSDSGSTYKDLFLIYDNGNTIASGNSYAVHFYESSDRTLKKNVKSILSSTNIPKVREFDWKDTGEHSYGFIAQELEEQGYGCLVNEVNGKKTVNYTATLALTVAKLQNLINIQNKKISNLTKELKALKYGRKKNS